MLKLNIELNKFESNKNLEPINFMPFGDKNTLIALSNFYHLTPVIIKLKAEGRLNWIGVFFIKEIKGEKCLFSGGRFGFLGFHEKVKIYPLNHYLNEIEKLCIEKNIKLISIADSYLKSDKENHLKKKDGWNLKEVTYLVANVKESVSAGKLSFSKSQKRSNVSRALKDAHNQSLKFNISKSIEQLIDWYENCHLKRIEELSGKSWDLKLFKDLITKGSGEIVSIYNDNNETLGGCFIINSSEVLELFMMSTPQINQKKNVNYFLTEVLYKLASERGNKYINWQASNPPTGSLINFKLNWNCKPMNFQILNKNFGSRLNDETMKIMCKDLFVYPYSML
jgi:hypothetical protein